MGLNLFDRSPAENISASKKNTKNVNDPWEDPALARAILEARNIPVTGPSRALLTIATHFAGAGHAAANARQGGGASSSTSIENSSDASGGVILTAGSSNSFEIRYAIGDPGDCPELAIDSVAVSCDGIIVRFLTGVTAAGKAATLASINGFIRETLRPDDGVQGETAIINIGAQLPGNVIEALRTSPIVDYAEPNKVMSVQFVSNDTYYANGAMWGMYGNQTSISNAYGSQAGEAWAAGFIGKTTTVVGDVDTGIDYTHPDLYLNVWLNQGELPVGIAAVDTDADGLITFRDLNQIANAAFVSDLNSNGRIDAGDLLADNRWANGLDNDGNGYIDDLIGWDFVNNDNNPYDDHNHGTHTSGTIGAMGGNGAGVAGVNWNIQIMGLKFLSGKGSGTLADAVRALDYYTDAAARDRSAGWASEFVGTNNSWGGGGYTQYLQDAITRAAQQDLVFVAAAGNSSANNDITQSFPANFSTLTTAGYESVISVAALASDGSLASYSNFGSTTVDLAAPGSGIWSTIAGGRYASSSGTSMATPHVTGALALLASMHPEYSASQLRSVLLSTTAFTPSLIGKTVTGGRLDIGALMNAPPAVTALMGSVGEDGPSFSQNLLMGQSDPNPGTTLSIVGLAGRVTTSGGRTLTLGTDYTLTGATLALTATGFAKFNSLANGATDTAVFDYAVSDGSLSSANALTLTITGANDAPVVSALTGSVGEDGPGFSQNLLSGQSDPDAGATLSVTGLASSVTTSGGRTLTLGTDYTLTGPTLALTATGFAKFNSLANGATDIAVFGYAVSDGSLSTANALTLTVTGANDAPVVVALTGSVGEDGPSFSQDLLSGQSDPDGDALSVTGLASSVTMNGGRTLTLGTDYTLIGATLALTATGFAKFNSLADGATDTAVFDYAVSDGTLSTANALSLTITGANDAPIVSNLILDQTAPQGLPFSFQFASNSFGDADVGDRLTYAASRGDGSSLPTWLAFDAINRRFTGTPPVTAPGSLDVRVTATDSGNASASDVFSINMTDINGPSNWKFTLANAGFDGTLSITANTVLGTITAIGDPNSASFAYSFVNSETDTATFQTLNGLTIDPSSGQISAATELTLSLNTWLRAQDQAGNRVTRRFIAQLGTSAANVINAPGGTTVVFALAGDDNITGTSADDALSGGLGNDSIIGGAGADTLNGGAGADTLNGGAGADAMYGGAGDDLYYVDNASDAIVEFSGEGTDTVYASVNWIMGSNQSIEFLRSYALNSLILTGNALNNQIIGGNANDILNGEGGDDLLNGGRGADVMNGGAGANTYYVDNIGDKVIEDSIASDPAGLKDTVVSTVGFALTDNNGNVASSIENLSLSGTDNIDGTGNALDNTINGNAGTNILRGEGGNDSLNGQQGVDTMYGGTGNDLYYVDNAGDSVIEFAGEGTDTVYASVNWIMGSTQSIELMRANAASAGLNLSGNNLNNQILGGDGSDTLRGEGGDDVLNGGLGADQLRGGAGRDTLTGGAAADWFIFEIAAQNGVDTVADFSQAQGDKLAFNAIDYGLSAGGPVSLTANATGAAFGSIAQFVYNTTNRSLWWDVDGAGGAGAIQIANFASGAPVLQASDFIAATASQFG